MYGNELPEGIENSNVFIARFNKRYQQDPELSPIRKRRLRRQKVRQMKNDDKNVLYILQERYGLYLLESGEIPKGTVVGSNGREFVYDDDVPYIRFFNPYGKSKVGDLVNNYRELMLSVDEELPGRDYTMSIDGDRLVFSFNNLGNSVSSLEISKAMQSNIYK